MAWQSYRQPSLTPRSTFDVDSDQGGGRLRSMSMSQLQHSRHGLGHGVLERASDEESVAGGSPLVQVVLYKQVRANAREGVHELHELHTSYTRASTLPYLPMY